MLDDQNDELEEKGDTKDSPVDGVIRRQDQQSTERLTYEKLCRGEKVKMIFQKKPLHCRYTDSGHPYMILQPAKLEVLHERPYIAQFRDIMTDEETKTLIELATPKLKRATVQNAVSGKDFF